MVCWLVGVLVMRSMRCVERVCYRCTERVGCVVNTIDTWY